MAISYKFEIDDDQLKVVTSGKDDHLEDSPS